MCKHTVQSDPLSSLTLQINLKISPTAESKIEQADVYPIDSTQARAAEHSLVLFSTDSAAATENGPNTLPYPRLCSRPGMFGTDREQL